MLTKNFLFISILVASASAFAYPVSRSFSCATVNPVYSSLDSTLNARTNHSDTDVTFDQVFTFKFRSNCDQVASKLQAACAYQYECGVLFLRAAECELHFARQHFVSSARGRPALGGGAAAKLRVRFRV